MNVVQGLVAEQSAARAQRAANVPVRDAVLAYARVPGGDEPGRAASGGLRGAARAAARAPRAPGRRGHGGRRGGVLLDTHGRRAAAAAAARARHRRHRGHGAPVHRRAPPLCIMRACIVQRLRPHPGDRQPAVSARCMRLLQCAVDSVCMLHCRSCKSAQSTQPRMALSMGGRPRTTCKLSFPDQCASTAVMSFSLTEVGCDS